MTIFIRVLSEELWLGAWAPVEAFLKENDVFVLAENNLTVDDEYEFFAAGTKVRVEKFVDEAGNEFLGAVEEIPIGSNSILMDN